MPTTNPESFAIKAIGYLESCYKDKFGTPRQPGLAPASTAKLKIFPQLQPEESLQGLDSFSHVWLIFWFHLNQTAQFHAKVHPPRLEGKSLGLFSTRTPHRPNPLGLSLVKLEKIEKDELFFSGIDLVNGTPILDIKPYLPQIESKTEASEGWTQQANTTTISVEFSPQAADTLTKWQHQKPELNLQQLIIETIQLDPRPLVYRGYEGQDSPYRADHAVRLYEGDIHFKFLQADLVQVHEIKLGKL